MSANIRVTLVDRLNRALSAWKQMRPTKRFGGLTADEFELELHKAAEARTRLVEAEKLYNQQKDQRDEADRHVRTVLQRVVNSIKGDPAEGPTSDLYRACGYVAPDERRRPLRNKHNVTTTPPVPQTPVAAEPTQVRAA